MAGLSRDQFVVDVTAVADELCPPPPAEPTTEPPVSLEPPSGPPTQVGGSCSLGHRNAPDARFCSTCGLPLGLPAPPAARVEVTRPRPAAELTAGEKAERERQHAQALAAASAFENQPEQVVAATGETVLIHFIEDGLTAFGRVWYRGQELEIGPSHPRWAEALGWITLDKYAQADRWGKQYFEHGPWPGRRTYTDPSDRYEQLAVVGGEGSFAGPGEEALRQADAAERQRGRAVPVSSFR